MTAPMIARRLRRALALPAIEQGLALEALIYLALCRGMLALLPFRIAMQWLGLRLHAGGIVSEAAPGSSTGPGTESGPGSAIGLAVQRASSIAPFKAVCLQQALAAALMLRRRGHDVEVYFGLAKDAEGKLIAHAWSKCQGGLVTGGQQMPHYTPISVFVT